MAYFQYCGKSTETILSVPLMLVNIDNQIDMVTTRSKSEGERTISRNITNEYGTIYEPLSFSYSLIKSDDTPFTTEEQVTIERWLTSPKLSSELIIRDCGIKKTITVDNVTEKTIEYDDVYYFGLFTSMTWGRGNGGIYYATFTFQVNGTYPYKRVSQQIWPPIVNGQEVDNASSGQIYVTCETDELEEYIYPLIRATSMDNNNLDFSVTQLSDGNNGFYVTAKNATPIEIDSQRCMIYNVSNYGGGLYKRTKMLRFTDVGWGELGSIYWLRLLDGENTLRIEGNARLTLIYTAPYKKVGGWLI